MASTNSSPKLQIRIFDEDGSSPIITNAYPVELVPGEVSVCRDGPVVEDHMYSMAVACGEPIESTVANVSINGDDSIRAYLTHVPRSGESGEYLYSLSFKDGDRNVSHKKLFLLTYGLVRIEVSIAGIGEFLTYDIPCVCSDRVRTSEVRAMLDTLLNDGNQAVADWMFSDEDCESDSFAIIESGLHRGTSKSLTSFLQLVQSVLDAYEAWYSYFRSNAYCVVRNDEKRLSGYDVRQLGVNEFTWLMSNSEVLSEVQAETGIAYNGKYYFPRYVRTEVKVKSYDNYENRVVLGFLSNTIIGSLRSTEAIMERDLQSIQVHINDLNTIKGSGEIPALVVMEECANREERYKTRISELKARAQRLMIQYQVIFPRVEPASKGASVPRRTKVFQEVRAYSAIYQQIEKWKAYGYFSLARESLALHALRLDKLYEYYCLYRLLEEFARLGYKPDSHYQHATLKARYFFADEVWFYNNERVVNSLYRLSRGSERVQLYYQPVIYGDAREQHGITLHRMSPRRAFAPHSLDTCYTPDFLISYDSGSHTKLFVLDAKYRELKSVSMPHSGWSTFNEAYYKYHADMSIDGVRSTDAVWLLVGKEDQADLRYYETSSWISSLEGYVKSGIATVSPSADRLHDLLDNLGITDDSDDVPTVNEWSEAKTQDLPNDAKADSIAAGTVDMEPGIELAQVGQIKENDTTTAELGHKGKSIHGQRNTGLDENISDLLERLVSIMGGTYRLYEQPWASKMLSVNHPILRYRLPTKGRESRLYTQIDLCGEEVYAYKAWRPNQINLLRRFVQQHEGEGK